VLSVKEDSLAIDAFHLMSEKLVTGVAVVNDSGRIRGALSTGDIKLISYDVRLFWRLGQTVKNFIIKLRKEYQEKHSRPRTIVTVSSSDTLDTVIGKLSAFKIHRIFIIDDKKIPIGEVSLGDLLLELVTESNFAPSLTLLKKNTQLPEYEHQELEMDEFF